MSAALDVAHFKLAQKIAKEISVDTGLAKKKACVPT